MLRRPKIAVVIPKYGVVGGAEHFAAEVTQRLARTTPCEFHVITHRWEPQTNSPVTFNRIPRLPFPRSLRPWAFALQVQMAIRRRHFDLVHSHDRIFSADIVSLHCTPHVAWVKDILNKRMSLFDRSTIAVERRLIRNGASATFLPVSSLGMEMFHHEYPAIPGKWEIMSPGVDYSRFSSPDRELCRQQIRHRYGIPLDAFVVLFSGMNFELKGLDSILESIALARRCRPEADFRLLVVGRGNVEKYRARAKRLGISAAVTFAGTITKGIEEFYRACDALMLLSKFDTFAMVVLEAMAAGLPVIISSNVGARDIVQHGCSGFVVGSQVDVRSCADHLGMLCRSEVGSDFGRAAAKAAAMRDWQVTTQQILKIYRSCLEKKGLSPQVM